jgi:hypothetical protein
MRPTDTVGAAEVRHGHPRLRRHPARRQLCRSGRWRPRAGRGRHRERRSGEAGARQLQRRGNQLSAQLGVNTGELGWLRIGGGADRHAGEWYELEVCVSEGADRGLELADVFVAAVAAGEVGLEVVSEVGWEDAVEVVGDEFDELCRTCREPHGRAAVASGWGDLPARGSCCGAPRHGGRPRRRRDRAHARSDPVRDSRELELGLSRGRPDLLGPRCLFCYQTTSRGYETGTTDRAHAGTGGTQLRASDEKQGPVAR